MINPKELMIDNWVYLSETTKYPMQVINISDDYIYLNFDENEGDPFDGIPKYVCPIPLSKEFLAKNGFKKRDDDENAYEYSDETFKVYLLKKSDGFEILADNHNFYLENFIVKYVHTLQNIFTLIGIDHKLKI